VFQFESRGMQGMLRDAKPSRLEDLIALNALYRPGPMDLIPSFCARKHGARRSSTRTRCWQVLSETYGIFVYQEQVMQAAQILGGYSLGGADLLRRAMGKKKAEEMAKHREIFRAGAARRASTQEKADEVFDLMEKFAGYGFNKSHAAAYSLLAYHTAWIKVHCTAEFYAANMTIEMDDTDKLKVLLADAKLFGISFEPPDVNRGTYRFEPVTDKLVRYGLGAVKGTGQGAIEAIVARARAPRAGRRALPQPVRLLRPRRPQRVNKRVVEALIKAGAFDALHADRAAACWPAWAWPSTGPTRRRPTRCRAGCSTSATTHGSSTQEPALVHVPPWASRAAAVREDGAGLLPVGPPVRAERRRGAALLQAPAASPTWSTAASRSCWPAS
jgi:DNA polymerase-3 subunit alpha